MKRPAPMKPCRLLFIANDADYFADMRLVIAEGARSAGYDVHIAVSPGPGAKKIEASGFTLHSVPMVRGGTKPIQEIRTIAALVPLFLSLRPQIVHLVALKPILYGGIAARLVRVPNVVAAVAGLGSVFISSEHRRGIFLKRTVQLFYRLALSNPRVKVIFQNREDMKTIQSLTGIKPTQAVLIGGGSGVDLHRYAMTPEPAGIPVVVQISRLLADKGVFEYVQAARILKNRGTAAKFLLAGSTDPANPTSLSDRDLVELRQEGVVELIGFQADVPNLLSNCNIVVLPSYREGFPKVLIEAAACGRAVVATDVSGCRDAVVDGATGTLVPVRNAEALADAIGRLIEEPERRLQMGTRARALAEENFDVRHVVDSHIKLYDEITAESKPTFIF